MLHRRLVELEPGKADFLVLLKSPLGKAIRYTLGQWEALGRYLEDGRCEIDTNLVENSIRPTAVGQLPRTAARQLEASGRLSQSTQRSANQTAHPTRETAPGNHGARRTLTDEFGSSRVEDTED